MNIKLLIIMIFFLVFNVNLSEFLVECFYLLINLVYINIYNELNVINILVFKKNNYMNILLVII